MKVLLLGGTGAMGTHLAQLLKEREIKTYVSSRRERVSEGNLEYLLGDAKDISFLKKILHKEQWDAIVDFMVYTPTSFNERVSLLLNNTKQYIFLSSARVYANSELAINEDSPRLLDNCQNKEYLLTNEYALSKARQENILRGSHYNNWTVIRPYITYSEQRLQLGVLEKEEWLYRALHGRTIVFSSDIMKKMTTLTYGFDVARGIAQIIGNPSALSQAYHITTNQSIKWEEVLELYLSILERHLKYRPKTLFLNIDSFISTKSGCKYQVCYDRLYDRIFDNSKFTHDQDVINPYKETKEGLSKCLEEFLKDPQFLHINWINEARRDRQAKEYTPLREISGIKLKIKYLLYRFGLKK